MTNLIGYLKKTQVLAFSFILSLTLSILFVGKSYAAPAVTPQIKTSIEIKYKLQNQILSAEYTILMVTDSTYPSVINYNNLLVPFNNISDVAISSITGNYSVSSTVQGANTELLIDYKGDIVKNDRALSAVISFTINDMVSGLSGQLNKLILPAKFAKDVEIPQLAITFETSIGGLQYISERPAKISSNQTLTTLEFSKPVFEFVSLVIGPVISYDFEITKDIANDSDTQLNYDVNIPKSQFNQTVTFSNITPTPSFSFTDKDSNTFFRYTLEPGQKASISITGNISISKKYETIIPSAKELGILTQNLGYWEIADQNELKRFELYLKKNNVEFDSNAKPISSENLVKYTYQYVIDRLTISALNVDSTAEGSLRGGASLALQRKTESTADDYADLLIALLRKYKVPCEMVVGYVAPVDTSSSGYFHTWIQYWMKDSGWRTLDPALDDLSTKDLFNSEYFDHIAIISRGSNPISPKIPSTAPSEYSFKLATATPDINNDVSIKSTITSVFNYQSETEGTITIVNNGNSIINNYELKSTPLSKKDLTYKQLIVPGQSLLVPVRYSLLAGDHFVNTVDLSGVLVISNSNMETFQSIFNLQLNIVRAWWWDVLIIMIGLTITTIICTLLWLLVKKSNIIQTMYKSNNTANERNKSIVKATLIICMLFALISTPVNAQTVATPGSVDTTETSTTVVTKKNVDFTIELEIGTQSAWDGSVPITAKFLPSEDVAETEVSWDVPQGLNYSLNYSNYFPVQKDQVYVATATFYPVTAGTYDIAVNITAWNVASNTASSKKVIISFDKNLIVTPVQAGYQANLIVKYIVLGVGGIIALFLAFILAKKGVKRFTKWFLPHEEL